MQNIINKINKIVNITISIIYTIVSFILFLSVVILCLISPIAFAAAIIGISNAAGVNFNKAGPVTRYVFGTVIALTVFSLFFSFKSISQIVKGFFREPRIYGIKNKLNELRDIVNSVSDKVNVSKFVEIYLVNENEISTYYTAKGRFLVLSIFALRFLTIEELKSIIAHECAHHHNSAMLLNRIHYRFKMLYSGFFSVYSSLLINNEKRQKRWGHLPIIGAGVLVISLTNLFNMIFVLPYSLFIKLIDIFIRKSNLEYEYYCDFIAYSNYGTNVFNKALNKVIDISIAHQYMNNIKGDMNDFYFAYSTIGINFKDIKHNLMISKNSSHPITQNRLIKSDEMSIYVKDYSKALINDEKLSELKVIIEKKNIA